MKSGITTSEFWVTIVYTILMSLVGFGVIPQGEADELKDVLSPLIAAAVPVAMYVYSRAKVKSAK